MVNLELWAKVSKLFIIKLSPITCYEDLGYTKLSNHKFPQEKNNLISSKGGYGFSLDPPGYHLPG